MVDPEIARSIGAPSMERRSERQLEGTADGIVGAIVPGSPTSAIPIGRSSGMVVLKLADETLRNVGNVRRT